MLLGAAPEQDPKHSIQSCHRFSVHPDGASSCLSEAMENSHTVWKTILQIARSSGIAGIAVEKGPENLVQGARETWQMRGQK